MISLPNGCSCSALSVHPKNWKRTGASVKDTWYIHYRYYDPQLCPKGKQFIVKGGVNKYKTLPERRIAVQALLDELKILLEDEGFNPITGQRVLSDTTEGQYSTLRLGDALTAAVDRVTVCDAMRVDLRGMVKHFNQVARNLGFSTFPLREVRRKHIRAGLEQLAKDRQLSASRFNKYRTYLGILFNEFVQDEAVDYNYVRDIKKRKEVQLIRQTLTREERDRVAAHLSAKYPRFWLFVQLFFHSGARVTELLALRPGDVDLQAQRFKVIVRKGAVSREAWRPIKDVSVELWRQAMEGAGEGQYIFSDRLKPGSEMIRRDQISRRWKRLVKDQIGITADFYSIRHLNIDEVAAALDMQAAAAAAGHTTPVITLKHYATGERGRMDERIKRVRNEF